MQVFKLFIKILKKNIPTAMIYLVIFISISVAMTKNASTDKMFKDTKMKVTVFDEDDTPESHALVDLIGSKHELVELENDHDTIMQQLYFETVDYVLIINKGYAEKLCSEDTSTLFSTYHMHSSYSVVLMNQTLDSYVSTVRAYTAAGHDITEASELTADALSRKVEINIPSFNESKEYGKSIASYFQYFVYCIISVIISTLCPVLITLNKKELRFRTNCSCLKTSSYSAQLIAGSLIFIAVLWILLMAVGVFLNGAMFTGKARYALLNSFIFTAITGGIALLICEFSPSDMAVKVMNQVVGLGMCFLCGVFTPQSMLGGKALAIGRFLPAYWYIKVNNMLSGEEMFNRTEIAECMLIEVGFAVTLLLTALVVHRVKYSSAAIHLAVPKVKTEH